MVETGRKSIRCRWRHERELGKRSIKMAVIGEGEGGRKRGSSGREREKVKVKVEFVEAAWRERGGSPAQEYISKEISDDTRGRFHARWKAEGGTGHGNKSFAVRDRMIDVCSGKKNARFAAVTKWQIGVETCLVRVWDRLG